MSPKHAAYRGARHPLSVVSRRRYPVPVQTSTEKRMRSSPSQIVWVLALGCLSTQVLVIKGRPPSVGVEEVCADFADGKSAWTMADCIEVWTQFTDSAPESLRRPKRLVLVDALKEPAAELRRAGTPCLAASKPHGDGVGSTTVRLIASWLLSKEMGCDWVTPDWGKPFVPGANGTVRYCHRTVDKSKMNLLNQTITEQTALEHCWVVDWLSYFQFGASSVHLPEGANIKEIEASMSVFYRSEPQAVKSYHIFQIMESPSRMNRRCCLSID